MRISLGRTLRLACLLACVAALATPARSRAICRVVEPTEDSGYAAVPFDPTTSAIAVISPDQLVDYQCAGRVVPRDPSVSLEPDLGADMAGAIARHDAGVSDAGADDVVRCEDGSPAAEVRDSLVSLVVRPAIYANGGQAGLVMPLPARADVHLAPGGIFEEIEALVRPRVEETIEFVENPSVGLQCTDPHYSALEDVAGASLALYGCGEASGTYYRPGLEHFDAEVFETDGGVVRFERIPATEDYDVTVLNASSLDALTAWMDANKFAHGEIDDRAFGAYVRDGAWFLALKVHPASTDGGRVALAPLVVTWRGGTLPIANRLTFDPRGGILFTDLLVLADSRMDADDDSAITELALSTVLPEAGALASFGRESAWLTRLHLTRLQNEEKPDGQLVPAADPSEIRPVITRRRRVQIAAACCGGNGIPRSGFRTFTEHRTYFVGEEPSDDSLFYRAPAATPAMCAGGSSYDGGYGYSYCAVSPHTVATFFGWLPIGATVLAIVLRTRRARRATSRRGSSR